MAIYTTLQKGSSGDDVKKLQQSLADAGYNIGSAGADGIYGADTETAVRQYQADNKLDEDGVAGEKTLGSLYGNSGASGNGAPAANTGATAKPEVPAFRYDDSTNEAYMQAMSALQQAQKDMPVYGNSYGQQMQQLYDQIVNRDKFSYDINRDALYQQLADQYENQGKLAMMDTMGQAASLTGGYGSSYGQSVGQQQYQAYLQKLNEQIPELYGMALDQYNQEGQEMLNRFALLGDMADDEYGKYQDALDRHWQNVSFLDQQADEAYDRGYSEWYNGIQLEKDAQDREYQKEQDAYDRLVTLITTSGYTPGAEELAAAGMSKAQADSFAKYYQQQTTPVVTGSTEGNELLSVSEWNSIDNRCKELIALEDKDGLKDYLSGLYNRGYISKDEFADFYEAYVLEEEPIDTGVVKQPDFGQPTWQWAQNISHARR